MAQSMAFSHNTHHGARTIRSISPIGASSQLSARSRSKRERANTQKSTSQTGIVSSCAGRSTFSCLIIESGPSMERASRASTTFASTRFAGRFPASISTAGAKSMLPIPSVSSCRETNCGVRFQQLELKHIEDKGCFAAMEFR